MTFVNMYSPGLKVLATHRVLRNVAAGVTLLGKAASAGWKGSMLPSLDDLKRRLSLSKPGTVQIGVVTRDHNLMFERLRKDHEMDVTVLHQEILGGMLGISEEAVAKKSIFNTSAVWTPPLPRSERKALKPLSCWNRHP